MRGWLRAMSQRLGCHNHCLKYQEGRRAGVVARFRPFDEFLPASPPHFRSNFDFILEKLRRPTSIGLLLRYAPKKKLRAMSLIFHGLCRGILCGVRRRLECDVIAELGDLAGEALDFRFGGSAVEVGG